MEPFSTSGFVIAEGQLFWDLSSSDEIVASAESELSLLTFTEINNFTIQMKSVNGKYLSYNETTNMIQATADTPDEKCNWRVYNVGGKITFKDNNGKFIQRGGYVYGTGANLPHPAWGTFTVELPSVKSGKITRRESMVSSERSVYST